MFTKIFWSKNVFCIFRSNGHFLVLFFYLFVPLDLVFGPSVFKIKPFQQTSSLMFHLKVHFSITFIHVIDLLVLIKYDRNYA